MNTSTNVNTINKCGFVFENNRCNKEANLQHKWNDRYFCLEHYNEVWNAREKLKKELIEDYKITIQEKILAIFRE